MDGEWWEISSTSRRLVYITGWYSIERWYRRFSWERERALKIHFRGFEVRKRVALTISRGMQAGSRNWEIEVEDEGVSGFGESAEFSIPGLVQDYDYLGRELERATALISSYSAWDRQQALLRLQAHSVASSVRAGIDMALWDWCGKVCRGV